MKSDLTSIKIPEIDLEVKPGNFRSPHLTVELFLASIIKHLEEVITCCLKCLETENYNNVITFGEVDSTKIFDLMKLKKLMEFHKNFCSFM